jgi:hypothetical protein
MIELTSDDLHRLHKFSLDAAEVLNAGYDDAAALLLDRKWEAEASWDGDGNVVVKLREVEVVSVA